MIKKIEFVKLEEIKTTYTDLSMDMLVMAFVGTANGFFWCSVDFTNIFETWGTLITPLGIVVLGLWYFKKRGYKLF